MARVEALGDLCLLAERAANADLVGDIVLDGAETARLCRMIARRLRAGAGLGGDWAALTMLSAVNALHHITPDEGYEFRAPYCRMCGVDLPEWNRALGPAIAGFCERRGAQPRENAYRYVGLVWQHAGLRPPDAQSLGRRLCELGARHGWHALATDPRWLAAQLGDGWPSAYLQQFMRTPNGQQLCHNVVRLLALIADGVLPADEACEANERQARIIEAVLARQGDAEHGHAWQRAALRPIRDPTLALVGARLVLCFDERGVRRGAYRCAALGPVVNTRVTLDPLLPAYEGTVNHPTGPRGWRVRGWAPEDRLQFFRETDGVRLGVGAEECPAQESLALSTEANPGGFEVLESRGAFGIGATTVHLLRVRRAARSGEGDRWPELQWRGGALLREAVWPGCSVWNGAPPALFLVPGGPGWAVFADLDGQVRRLELGADGRIVVPASPGTHARLWAQPLRPQWRRRDAARLGAEYAVLPAMRLRGTERLVAAGQDVEFSCESADPDVHCTWSGAKADADGRRCRIPPPVTLVEGMVRYRSLEVPVAMQVHRASLTLAPHPAAPDGVVWVDAAESSVVVHVLPGAPVRVRLQSVFGVEVPGTEALGSANASGAATLSVVVLQERLRSIAIARVELRGDLGRWVDTGVWIGWSRRLDHLLRSWSQADLDAALPPGITRWLHGLHHLYNGDIAALPLARGAPPEVKALLDRLVSKAYEQTARSDGVLPAEASRRYRETAGPRRSARLEADVSRRRVQRWAGWVRGHASEAVAPPADLGVSRDISEAARRYLLAGTQPPGSAQRRALLTQVYQDLLDISPADGIERSVACSLAVLAARRLRPGDGLRLAANEALERLKPPALPPPVAQAAGLPSVAAPFVLGDLPVWPDDLPPEGAEDVTQRTAR